MTGTRTIRRAALRSTAALGLLLTLSGCGRTASRLPAAGSATGPTSTVARNTTTAVTEPPTTTTTPPEPARATPAVEPAAPAPVARPTTTRARTVVDPAAARPDPAEGRSVEPTTVLPAAPAPPLPATMTSHGGPVRDHVSLVDNLRGRGLTVTPVGPISQPFLHGDGTRLAITGPGIGAAEIQSYEYDTADGAAADAATFRPDGTPRTVMVDWVSAPHLYLRGRVIVVYVGTDPGVTSTLTDLLGPQFSGR